MQTSSGSEHSCRRRVLKDPRINSHSPKFTRGGFKRTGKVKDELLTEDHCGRLSERGSTGLEIWIVQPEEYEVQNVHA